MEIIGSTSALKDFVPLAGEEVAVIDTKYGQIVLRFYNDLAPGHVANIKKLAGQGFYDKTTFHRVIPGFMIQGGDPNTKGDNKASYGSGGPGHQVKAEFTREPHIRGTWSMARSQDPDSAGSQFFICHARAASLDNQYTVFGQVVKTGKEKEGEEAEGLKVVDKIVTIPSDQRANGMAEERVEMTMKIAKWPLN